MNAATSHRIPQAETPRPASPPAVVFRKSRMALGLWTVFGALMTLQGILTAGYFLFADRETGVGLKAAVVGVAAWLALFGAYFLFYAASRLRGPADAIVVGPAGLHDRMLSQHPIAWSGVSAIRVVRVRGGRSLAFELSDGAADLAGIRPLARFLAAIARALGYPGFSIHPMGTEADIDALVVAIKPYAKVAGSN